MYATTPDGSGTPDLIHNSADALASTAAFLKGHGWQPGAGWNEGEPNFAAILQWNSAEIYAKTVALFADRLAGSRPAAATARAFAATLSPSTIQSLNRVHGRKRRLTIAPIVEPDRDAR